MKLSPIPISTNTWSVISVVECHKKVNSIPMSTATTTTTSWLLQGSIEIKVNTSTQGIIAKDNRKHPIGICMEDLNCLGIIFAQPGGFSMGLKHGASWIYGNYPLHSRRPWIPKIEPQRWQLQNTSVENWIHTCNFFLQSHRVDLQGSHQRRMFWDFHLCYFQFLKQVWPAGVPSPCSSWPPWCNWVPHRWNWSTQQRGAWIVRRVMFPKIPKHLLPVCQKTLPHIQLQPL